MQEVGESLYVSPTEQGIHSGFILPFWARFEIWYYITVSCTGLRTH